MSNMMLILGDRLAQLTGKQESICRGLLRLSIMDSSPLAKITDGQKVLEYVNAMAYTDWRQVLDSEALLSRLKAVNVRDPESVIAKLKETLNIKQSLFTLSAR